MAALDWRDARHFDRTRDLPCRWCGKPTPLRDDQRKPSHKVCAEQHTEQLSVAPPPAAAGDGTTLPDPPPDPVKGVPVANWHRALTAAQHAAGRGLFVFPLARTKRPAIASPHPVGSARNCRGECGQLGHGVHDAGNDPQWVRELFDAAPWATAYGVACGRAPHHLVGIDLDVKHGQDGPGNFRALAAEHGFDIPATATVATPSGGLHYWFTAPADAQILNSQGRLAEGIDVRGTSGYLVGPGSRTAAGVYAFAPGTDPNTVAPLPGPLLALLTAPRTPAAIPDPVGLSERIYHQDRYTESAINGESAKVRAKQKPGRNRQLFISAATLGRLVAAGTLDADLATDALLSAGLACGLPEADCRGTIRRGFERAATSVPRAA